MSETGSRSDVRGRLRGTVGGSSSSSSPGAGNTTGSASGSAGASATGTAGTVVTSGSSGTGGPAGTGVILTAPPEQAAPEVATTPCTAGVAVTSQVTRLTNEQYDRTIRDLLGVTGLTSQGGVAPSLILATDQAGSLTDIAWANYQSVADMIATQVFADANLKKNFMACTPTGDGKACLHDTIIKFGRKAYRRPLSTDEIAAFDALVAKGATITPTGAVNEIAQTVLYTFLVSPPFLMRAETNDTPARWPASTRCRAGRSRPASPTCCGARRRTTRWPRRPTPAS
jgi:hypothetical protein